MASPIPTHPQPKVAQDKPSPGDLLLVIHDFAARSSDELTLIKGDRVHLIERDDEFGDGWYLGRHLTSGATGLFPEVYTRPAPRVSTSFAMPSKPVADNQIPSANTATPEPSSSHTTSSVPEQPNSAPVLDADGAAQAQRNISASVLDAMSSSSTPPVTSTPDLLKPAAPAPGQSAVLSKGVIMSSAAKLHTHGSDSPVMNETLSVIDEHITDMNSPQHSVVGRITNDSGSEYSSHIDHRLSYINGEETDEEEEGTYTREDVETWTIDQVAEYLFTAGVEASHCEVFRDQDITGDVLLSMDQTSVFLKEFNLGSVGRRLKTWQKIKLLQDEVNGEVSTRRNTATYGSDAGVDGASQNRSRTNTVTNLPRIPSLMDRPGSRHTARLSQQRQEPTTPTSPASKTIRGSPTRPISDNRPSAASIREFHHSRQNSIAESTAASPLSNVVGDFTKQQSRHKKEPSFDRNWTMGNASPAATNRPLSAAGFHGISRSSTDHMSQSTGQSVALDALDRGYFSGGEAEGRQRNVLKKRGNSTSHSRNSSYTDEQRVRSATTHSRQSRFGSVDSIRDTAPPSAAQKYYGLSVSRRRTPSASSTETGPRPTPPPKDNYARTVTKLEGSPYESMPVSPTAKARHSRPSEWLLPLKPTSQSKYTGLRAISDAITGHEKAHATSSAGQSSLKDSPMNSPSSKTGSSTPSGGASLDLDQQEAKTTTTVSSASSRPNKKKSKKETSAYQRGLEQKTPQEQVVDADYSGWMKKKSTTLMATWKSRLFVLKGRRLSYYYSEDDTEEKGLIDISFHRVLPADNERLTGLHATLTGATHSPTSPQGSQITTMAAENAAAEPESTLSKSKGDSMFIFKLVPPRAGLTSAVNFTKPTVHYFAVPSIKEGRLWMAALMKATIDRDDTKEVTTTYQQKTISLAKARAMRHRPPALMNVDEHVEEEANKTPDSDNAGLNISGIIFDRPQSREGDSGISGVSKQEQQLTPAIGTSTPSTSETNNLETSNVETSQTA
ncbi:hypothetical protein B7463_g10102, partial [Scytalidium lignicola]